MSNIRVTYSGLISFAITLVTVFTGLGFMIIVTRILSTQEYGTWGLINSLMIYGVVFTAIPVFWLARETARELKTEKTNITRLINQTNLNTSQQTVNKLTISDFDPVFIEDARRRDDPDWPIEYLLHDMTKEPTDRKYNAIYSVDVLEHINQKDEDTFLSNICKSLKPDGTAIIGIPSIESQQYASPASKAGHVNCKTGADFKGFMSGYFHHVFLFSMNDEVVHTGFDKMAHYLFCVCCGVK
jgi:hypothetical protein